MLTDEGGVWNEERVLAGLRGLGNGGKGRPVLTIGSFPAHVALHEGDDPNA